MFQFTEMDTGEKLHSLGLLHRHGSTFIGVINEILYVI